MLKRWISLAVGLGALTVVVYLIVRAQIRAGAERAARARTRRRCEAAARAGTHGLVHLQLLTVGTGADGARTLADLWDRAACPERIVMTVVHVRPAEGASLNVVQGYERLAKARDQRPRSDRVTYVVVDAAAAPDVWDARAAAPAAWDPRGDLTVCWSADLVPEPAWDEALEELHADAERLHKGPVLLTATPAGGLPAVRRAGEASGAAVVGEVRLRRRPPAAGTHALLRTEFLHAALCVGRPAVVQAVAAAGAGAFAASLRAQAAGVALLVPRVPVGTPRGTDPEPSVQELYVDAVEPEHALAQMQASRAALATALGPAAIEAACARMGLACDGAEAQVTEIGPRARAGACWDEPAWQTLLRMGNQTA